MSCMRRSECFWGLAATSAEGRGFVLRGLRRLTRVGINVLPDSLATDSARLPGRPRSMVNCLNSPACGESTAGGGATLPPVARERRCPAPGSLDNVNRLSSFATPAPGTPGQRRPVILQAADPKVRNVEYREFPVPAAVAHLIHCTWVLRGAGPARPMPVVPDGRAEIVVHLGEPFREGGAAQDAVMVSGQITRPLMLIPPPESLGAGFRLTTAGAGTLLPMEDLTDRVLPLREIRPALARAILDAFAGRGFADAGRDRVTALLAGYSSHQPSETTRNLVRLLERRPAATLKAARDPSGFSTRTLQRRFREEVGMPAGLLRRIIRFRRAFRLLSSIRPRQLAAAAAAAGYFDQSHLIRDFRRFAGSSPARFFRADPDLSVALLGGPQD